MWESLSIYIHVVIEKGDDRGETAWRNIITSSISATVYTLLYTMRLRATLYSCMTTYPVYTNIHASFPKKPKQIILPIQLTYTATHWNHNCIILKIQHTSIKSLLCCILWHTAIKYSTLRTVFSKHAGQCFLYTDIYMWWMIIVQLVVTTFNGPIVRQVYSIMISVLIRETVYWLLTMCYVIFIDFFNILLTEHSFISLSVLVLLGCHWEQNKTN